MSVRGIRGATTVTENTSDEILSATTELLKAIFDANGIETFDDLISCIFTTTLDLNAAFPAESARVLGLKEVPLLCCTEIPVPGAMPRCIRILLHVNTEKSLSEMKHIYLRDAKKLRPDVTAAQ
ncbi:chorismate mutase [Lacunimicrobium album]